MTARVATLEDRTAPSFAPLDGRVERVAVHIGELSLDEGDSLADFTAVGLELGLTRSTQPDASLRLP